MQKSDLEKLIRLGETQQTEFKEKFDEAVIETLVAFANATGGKVLVGVSDKGVVKGVFRDYRSSSDIVIKIFDHKIAFSNPGKLYGGLTVKDLKRDDYVSSLRNKLLAEMFYLLGDIEKYGTGLVRIRRILKDFPGLTLRLEEIGNYFKVDLAYPVQNGSQKSSQKSSQKIIQLIKEQPGITINKLALELNISERAIKKHLSNLKKQKLIKRIGPDKGGHWDV